MLKRIICIYLVVSIDNNNKLTGSIPTELGYLTELTRLELDESSFTGSIPTEIGLLTRLNHLEIRTWYPFATKRFPRIIIVWSFFLTLLLAFVLQIFQ
jgi:hypothetical protein